ICEEKSWHDTRADRGCAGERERAAAVTHQSVTRPAGGDAQAVPALCHHGEGNPRACGRGRASQSLVVRCDGPLAAVCEEGVQARHDGVLDRAVEAVGAGVIEARKSEKPEKPTRRRGGAQKTQTKTENPMLGTLPFALEKLVQCGPVLLDEPPIVRHA